MRRPAVPANVPSAKFHHRATGKDNFLRIARKTGDYLCDTFTDRKPELAHFGFNPSNIMGAVELYRTTGDRKYLRARVGRRLFLVHQCIAAFR